MTDPEISTKDHAGEFDAIETAKPGEPIFTLQGGDPLAPDLILAWAGKARAQALLLRDEKPAKADNLLRRATNAESIAWKFREYQSGIVDAEPERPESYNEVVQEKSAENDQRAARIKAVARIGNLRGEIETVMEMLAVVGTGNNGLHIAFDALGRAEKEIEPRSANERT